MLMRGLGSLPARLLNRAKDYLLFNPLLERHWLDAMRGQVTCLLYHRIDDPGRHAFLDWGGSPVTRPEELRVELGFLRDRGALFLTLADLRAGHYPRDNEIGIIVTFDDCFLDNYRQGLQVLTELGIPAVFFQATGMVDAREPIWEHALYWYLSEPARASAFIRVAQTEAILSDAGDARQESVRRVILSKLTRQVPALDVERLLHCAADRLDTGAALTALCDAMYPSKEDLRYIQAGGHEVGSHGHHHYFRDTIDAALFEEELETSRRHLLEITGRVPCAFSYPFNRYLPGDRASCGRYYAQVATVDGGRIDRTTDPLALPRYTWPGPTSNPWRRRRWLVSGGV